jgi:GNAT superfamily N-acetyltransferase
MKLNMEMKIRIEFLSENRGLIDQIAERFMVEWPRYYGPNGPGNALKDLEECCNTIELPIGLLALQGAIFCGYTSLRLQTDSHPHLKPWLTALYVVPEMRRQGIATLLVHGVVSLAKNLGFSNLYARSETAVHLFNKLNWIPFDRLVIQDQNLTVFDKNLCAE